MIKQYTHRFESKEERAAFWVGMTTANTMNLEAGLQPAQITEIRLVDHLDNWIDEYAFLGRSVAPGSRGTFGILYEIGTEAEFSARDHDEDLSEEAAEGYKHFTSDCERDASWAKLREAAKEMWVGDLDKLAENDAFHATAEALTLWIDTHAHENKMGWAANLHAAYPEDIDKCEIHNKMISLLRIEALGLA
jgi:hypothetical protein